MPSNPVKKILILAANPQDNRLHPLRLEKEVAEIRKTHRAANNRDNFEIEAHGAVCPEDLQQHLYDFKPQIVHFSGHGVGEEGLVFENEKGGLQLVDNEILGDLFRLFAREIECVVLNACYAEVQAEVISRYIPYVIGMNQAIGDEAARIFAKGFYGGIWDERTIEDAFALGVNAIALESTTKEELAEADIPVLLKRKSKMVDSAIPIVESNGYFFIVRSHLEQRCEQELIKPGALIRIKSPERMGKTWMMGRVLEAAAQQGYRSAVVDLREANQETFGNVNQFLQWFCACVGDQLGVEQRPEDAWKAYLGASTNCTKYIDKFFLSSSEESLIIAIDNFDYIFQYPAIVADFCGLLRGWFEKVNTSKVWGKLRQIIVYSQEDYATLNINQSPFNVGLPIDLGELEPAAVIALSNAYGLQWSEAEINKLMAMIGGHPYLVQLAIERVLHHNLDLEELLRTAPTEEGIYRGYLYDRLQQLEGNPDLLAAMLKVVNSDDLTRLGSTETFRLDSMGLIKRRGNDISSRCDLYRLYFRDRLQ